MTQTPAARMDFVVIGAMKAATSTVCAYLEDHPEVYMVPGAELRFFSHDENHAKGVAWYHGHLAEHTTEKLCGEGSNSYSYRAQFPDAAARIAAYNPQMKIIYMVRHPLERIASAWVQNRVDQRDLVPATLDRAVLDMPERYVGQSLFWHNISPYRELFGDERIFVGFMEDLRSAPEAFFADLSAFLGVSPAPRLQRPHLNKSDGKRVPTPVYSALRKNPLVATLKGLLPRQMRRLVRDKALSRSLQEKPVFSPEVRAQLVAEIAPDSAAFLQHFGKPADFWSF